MTGWTYRRLSGAGRSAVSVCRCTGLTSQDRAVLEALGIPSRVYPSNRVRLIAFGPEPAEDCVIIERSPSEFEIHSHGGQAVFDRLESLLQSAGGTSAQELTFDEQCWSLVSQATTRRVALRLAQLADGDLRDYLEQLRAARLQQQQTGLLKLIKDTPAGLAMVAGPTIAIIGLPNAGKSSLLNRLVGFERSLIDPRPGATRDMVAVQSAIDGYPVTFTDTAGLRSSPDAIEQEGVRRTRAAANSAELVVLVVDRSLLASGETHALLRDHREAILVAHKSDLRDQAELRWPSGVIAVSSETGDGVDALIDAIARRLATQRLPDETPFLMSEEQLDLAQQLLDCPQDDSLWAELLS